MTEATQAVGASCERHASESDRPAIFRGKLWFWAPITPLVILDLWSKAAVFAHLESTQPTTPARSRMLELGILPEPLRLGFVTWHNPGTIWGLGQDFTIVLVLLRIAALFLLVYFAWRTAPARRAQQLVLGLIMAGANRGVRDFIYLHTFNERGEISWDFPAFNVADSCICVGAFTLAILLWRHDKPRAGVAKSNAQPRA
jgi:lipoprotein signal peptidase